MRSIFSFLVILFCSTHLQAQGEGVELLNPPITIVVLGSSTAEGAGTWPLDFAWVNRYRRYVQGYNPNNQVINLAKGGYNTYHLLPSATEPPRDRTKPDTARNITKALEYNPHGIIINLPSNDISGGFSVKEQLDNFRTYAAIADANGIELWVTTTQPRNFPKSRDRELQATVRDSLIAIFPNNYIDFWTEFADADHRVVKSYDSGDGCHLNNEGHRILTERVTSVLPFNEKLLESASQQDISVELHDDLSPHMINIGFKGIIAFPADRKEEARHVKIRQYGKLLSDVEVQDTSYEIKAIIDLRYDLKVEFESHNGLTKVIHIDLKELTNEERLKTTYFPIESLDISEISLKELNYQFPKASLTMASFKYDARKSVLTINKHYSQLQQQRLEDAALFPPTKGNKLVTYWENGNKKSVLRFKNGQLNCKSRWFHENGKKERTVFFKNGAYNGKYIIYNTSGKKKITRKFKNDKEIITPTDSK